MVIFFKRILIICLLTFLQSYVIAQNNYSCDKAKRFVLNFVHTKQSDDWNIIEDNSEELQSCKCEMAPALYYIYHMKAVLPNSQSLQNISPNDYILSQKLKMNEQINILKTCDKGSYSLLIKSMANQKFDEEISKTAIDLESKLSSK